MTTSMKLPKGVRYIERSTTGGIQMAQVTFGGPTGIFVECIDCDRMDRIKGPNDACDAISDDHAEAIFRDRGWTVGPTRCPDHARFRGGTS